MFLDRLRVISNGTPIRDIRFRKGLNLILDLTSGKSTDSGNNVGKTTLLRCIDYCLGATGDELHKDPEFKTTNKEIYNFLTQRNVIFELEASSATRTLRITRPFGEPPIINGERLGPEAAKNKIGYELFRLRAQKPSSRQLLRKFIRIGEHQTSNTLRFLHPATSMENYEPVWLFLFGFDDQELLQHRRDLQRQLKAVSNQLAGFEEISKDSLRQMIAIIDRDIEEKQKQLERFEVGASIKNELAQLSTVRGAISEVSIQLAQLQLQAQSSERTIQSLKSAATSIDASRLEELYQAAKRELPSLARKFSELQSFHNAMIENKVHFVQQNVDRIRAQLKGRDAELNALTAQEAQLLRSVATQGPLADLNKVHNEVSMLRENRGERTGLLSRIEELEKEHATARTSLDSANDEIISDIKRVNQRIERFNLAFSEYSYRLYGDKYVLSCDSKDVDGVKRFDFKISNVMGNEGTGKKRAQVAAFDLAYLKLQAELNAETVRFTLHDRVETISANQLQTLFEIAEGIDGQFMVCVLADKLSSVNQTLVDEATVLRLSQTDKFFRLP